MWRWLYVFQLAATEQAPVSAELKLVPPPCAKASGDEIVVCRSRNTRERYGPRLSETPEPLLPDAEFRLFGKVRGAVAGEQRAVGGFSAPAAMVTVRVPF